MARLEVVQVQCDRCKRVELQAVSPVAKVQPDFEARFDANRLVYGDLCTHCRETIARLWQAMAEWERELKQALGPTVSNNQAAPLSPAPDYSPPKPHSAAAGQKK